MANITRFDASTRDLMRECMKRTATIIAPYRWIINAYVSDFYTKEFWSYLPDSLQKYFDATHPPGLAWLLCSFDGQRTCCRPDSHTIPPLSLLALRQCINILALQRTAIDPELPTTREMLGAALTGREKNVAEDHRESSSGCATSQAEPDYAKKKEYLMPAAAGATPNYKNGQCMDMQHIFRKHVKPKKQHEINNLGQIISLVGKASACSTVVDVGAGLGHLARILSFQHGLRVTTIEATGGHAPRASELDKDLKKNIHKVKMRKKQTTAEKTPSSVALPLDDAIKGMKGDEVPAHTPDSNQVSHHDDQAQCSQSSTGEVLSFNKHGGDICDDENDAEMPSHVICTVQPDIAASQFLQILDERPNQEQKIETSDPTFVLTGLHACGDLTPTLLRVFLTCPAAQGLASVGCCYMKMTATHSSDATALDNFPMSSYLRSQQTLQGLSYEAREMACHFADAYHQRLLENPLHLKIHSYRAALQLLVTTVNPTFKSGQARLTSKKGATGTFTQYAAEIIKKLQMNLDSVPSALLDQCEELTHQWERVVAFYTLRLSLAPLVETLILCDRALFLLENGISSLLVPIFDSHLSPRNFALLAVKGKYCT